MFGLVWKGKQFDYVEFVSCLMSSLHLCTEARNCLQSLQDLGKHFVQTSFIFHLV